MNTMTEQEIQALSALTTDEIQATLDGVKAIHGAGWIESDPVYQAIQRIREIRRDLGGDENVFARVPEPAKRMKQAAYQRRLDELVGCYARAFMTLSMRREAAPGDVGTNWLVVYLWVEEQRAREGEAYVRDAA